MQPEDLEPGKLLDLPAYICREHASTIRYACAECHIAHLERRLAAAYRLRNEVRGILGAFGNDIAEAVGCSNHQALAKALRDYEETKEPKP